MKVQMGMASNGKFGFKGLTAIKNIRQTRNIYFVDLKGRNLTDVVPSTGITAGYGFIQTCGGWKSICNVE